MDRRPLGRTNILVSTIGFGAFKIGRNTDTKYAEGYTLPSDDEVASLLDGVLDAGINLIDTAPAYGTSEERIGRWLGARRNEVVLVTKAGETYDGSSTYAYDAASIRRSVQSSLRRLGTDAVDVLLIHSDGRDREILEETDAVETLIDLRRAGLTRAIGLSGKTVEGAMSALGWADVIMAELSPTNTDHAGVIGTAHDAGIGVLVKKGLGSGQVPAEEAIPFVLGTPGVSSLVIGGLNLDHVRANVAIATGATGS